MKRFCLWWHKHMPWWTWPCNPYGVKARQEMPERHRVVNELAALGLRMERLERLRARADFAQWRERPDG